MSEPSKRIQRSADGVLRQWGEPALRPTCKTMSTAIDTLDLSKQVEDAIQLCAITACNHFGNPQCIRPAAYAQLYTTVRLLIQRFEGFGVSATLQKGLPKEAEDSLDATHRIEGLLRSLKDAIDRGQLVQFSSLVTAGVFADFVEQAEELLRSGFCLPSAVLLRAVLEEHLRKLCVRHNCFPSCSKPTIETLKQSLATASVLDKISVKKVDWMAGVGNSAAHNLPSFQERDVQELFRATVDFLDRHRI